MTTGKRRCPAYNGAALRPAANRLGPQNATVIDDQNPSPTRNPPLAKAPPAAPDHAKSAPLPPLPVPWERVGVRVVLRFSFFVFHSFPCRPPERKTKNEKCKTQNERRRLLHHLRHPRVDAPPFRLHD